MKMNNNSTKSNRFIELESGMQIFSYENKITLCDESTFINLVVIIFDASRKISLELISILICIYNIRCICSQTINNLSLDSVKLMENVTVFLLNFLLNLATPLKTYIEFIICSTWFLFFSRATRNHFMNMYVRIMSWCSPISGKRFYLHANKMKCCNWIHPTSQPDSQCDKNRNWWR